ncbi:MAG: hypothetical protein AB8B56_19655 [Crocinitomicaceae bacterium]
MTLIMLGFLGVLTSLKFTKNELPWRIIALYLIGGFIAHGISMLYWLNEWNNLTVLHFYSIFQFIAFSVFYWSTTQNKTKRLLIIIASGAVTGLLVLNSIWIESVKDFNSLGVFLSNGTIVVYSVAYFFEVLGADVQSKKYLIVNAGILLFVSESLVIFLFGNLLKDVATIDQAGLWYTHAYAYIIFLLLILWNHVKLNR